MDIHKATPILLASGSEIRAQLLRQAGLDVTVQKPRIDEEMISDGLRAEGATPRDVADTLAEMKARKIAEKNLDALVLGCDQVLDHKGSILFKPTTREDAISQLAELSGGHHSLLSAAVLYHDAKPIWRHVGQVRLTMRVLSPEFIAAYVDRNWDSIRHAVGCYKLEEEGVRLFSDIQGDYFTVLGLPLVQLLSFLTDRGDLKI